MRHPRHIALTEKADLMLVAPATANMLAKVANGICDDLISLMINAAGCPVIFAPAMNNRMWDNPITQENIARLTRHGYGMIGPESGWLACRNIGMGRMSESAKIVAEISQMLAQPPLTSVAASDKQEPLNIASKGPEIG